MDHSSRSGTKENTTDIDATPPEDEHTTRNSTITERAIDREVENQEYVPVIIKRNDEVVRHPDDILEKAIEEGVEQLNRPIFSLSLSSLAAGMILGFTAMVVGVVSTGLAELNDPALTRFATALVYPLGFIICIMSGAQLFTEHTATAVYPVLDRQSSATKLLRLWSIVVTFNIIGAAISAVMLVLAENTIQAKAGYIIVAHHLVSPAAHDLIVSSVMAGWLMALGAWLIMATGPTITNVVCIYIVTLLIGMGGLHHSISGSVEMLTAFFISDQFTLWQSARFIGLAVFGNLIGGIVFVALLNYGHVRKTQRLEDE